MEGPVAPPAPRTITPAVLASAMFLVICAAVAISVVAARGGLQMPVAPTRSAVAVASESASSVPGPSASPATTPAVATPASSTVPTAEATPARTPAFPPEPTATPGGPPDPLTTLPACPDVPGCYAYTIQRGDSLTGVASRYSIDPSVVLALNPEISDPGTIVVGQILYVGRDPFLRLPTCPEVPACSVYTVRAGDRLSTIAGRFGITTVAILIANPAISDANAIFTGQLIRLPHPAT